MQIKMISGLTTDVVETLVNQWLAGRDAGFKIVQVQTTTVPQGGVDDGRREFFILVTILHE